MGLYAVEENIFNDARAKLHLNPQASFSFTPKPKPKEELYRVENGKAIISITGFLEKEKSFWSLFFGEDGLTYNEIIQAIIQVDADQKTDDEYDIYINSPGGNVDGVFAVATALRNANKKSRVIVDNLCASAAYWIASQADEIHAYPTALIGSIGIIAHYVNDAKAKEKAGFEDCVITSTKAPDKYNDPATEEGKSNIQKELDGIHNVFADCVAKGRNTTVEIVDKTFGKGGVLIAKEAADVGMVDKVIEGKDNNILKFESKTEEEVMDINKLKADFPELHNSIYSEGVQHGKKEEQERISSLMEFSNIEGAKDIIDEAIRTGKGPGQVSAQMFTLISNQKQKVNKDREGDNPPAVSTAQKQVDKNQKAVDDYATAILEVINA